MQDSRICVRLLQYVYPSFPRSLPRSHVQGPRLSFVARWTKYPGQLQNEIKTSKMNTLVTVSASTGQAFYRMTLISKPFSFATLLIKSNNKKR